MKTPIPPPAIRACLSVLASALLALSLSACLTLESVNCSPELSCRGGMTCAAADDVCISAMSPSCGNGVEEPGEACDDGNLRDKDGCSADCKSKEFCGNGVLDLTIGEVCDTLSPENGGKCSPDCRSLQGCGNRYVDPGEECDDGNDNSNDDCIDCTLARCGDGFTNTGKEECDPRNDPTGCDLNCTLRWCGDGTINTAAGEQCEPNQPNNVLCTSTCIISRCGDGRVDQAEGEVCDDGNNDTELACPYGLATCKLCSADCKQERSLQGPTCGDGVRNGSEECDDGNTDTETVCPYGSPTCTVCAGNCKEQTLHGGEYCGDGIKNGPEACDDANADACGTCNADCTQIQRGHARGKIIVPEPKNPNDALINEGEQIIISDGIKTVTIEFTMIWDPDQSAGYRLIKVPKNASATDLAETLYQLFRNFSQAELNISSTSRDGTTVYLRHREIGAYGNRIISQPFPSRIAARGMIEGTGRNCPEHMACTSTDDCEPALACRSSSKSCEL